MISAQQIKDLRERTGAGISDIKKALEESKGDAVKAEEIIRQKLGLAAGKRAGRETAAGVIESYIHANARVGAMVELLCETDFVARNPGFKSVAHDLAMQVAAMRPVWLSFDSIPIEVRDAEQRRFTEEVKAMDKPTHVSAAIVEGKVKVHFNGMALLSQPFVKDQNKTVGEMLNEAIGRFGENINIGRFVRFEL